jgi:hypothetical protein
MKTRLEMTDAAVLALMALANCWSFRGALLREPGIQGGRGSWLLDSGFRQRRPRNDRCYPHFTPCRASTSRTLATKSPSGTANWAAACFCR